MVLHKSTIWEEQWKNMTENSGVATKISDMRIQFEESENILVRIARGAVERVSEGIGGTFGEGETAMVMASDTHIVYNLAPPFLAKDHDLRCVLRPSTKGCGNHVSNPEP